MRQLFGRDGGDILENVHLFLLRRQLEFDAALSPSACEVELHRRSRAHSRKLVVEGRGGGPSIHFDDMVADCHSSPLSIAVGVYRSYFRLAPKIRTSRKPRSGSAHRCFCHLKSDELEIFVIGQLQNSGHVILEEFRETLSGYSFGRLLYS